MPYFSLLSHFGAEDFFNFIKCSFRVLDGIVQQRGLQDHRVGDMTCVGSTLYYYTRGLVHRDGEVPQMTKGPQYTSPRIWEDLALGTGPQYRSFAIVRPTSSPLQVLNFRELVGTAGTVLPVLPIPACPTKIEF